MTPLAARIIEALRANPQTYDELSATLTEPRPRIAGAVNSMNGNGSVHVWREKPWRWAPTPMGIRLHNAHREQLTLDA